MKNEETTMDQIQGNPDNDPKVKVNEGTNEGTNKGTNEGTNEGVNEENNEVKEESDAKAVKEEGKGKSSFRKEAAAGLGAGILLGSATSLGFSNEAPIPTDNPGKGPEQNLGQDSVGNEAYSHDNDAHTPDWAVGDVNVATSVSDEMSFSKAFAAARAEVGPGGAFEWRGNVYGTYYAEEWESMTPEDRQEYNSHFSWNQHQNTDSAETMDEPDVVIVDEDTDDISDEVEILGIIPDDESGQEVYLIDVDEDVDEDVDVDIVVDVDEDGDGDAFDDMVSELNNDGGLTDAMYDSGDDELDDFDDDMIG